MGVKRMAMLGVLLLAATGCGTATAVKPPEAGWTENYAAAMTQAQQEHKQLLLNFTGSDWCPPCQALDRTVLDSEAFKQWAAGKYVLVTLDYPSHKQQDEATKARNQDLQKQFKIEGYPTIIITDAQGKELTRTVGFNEKQTAQAWIADMDAALKKGGAS